ncbi:HupE/UreJ family protein [Nocardioides sp. SYSU DS0651]|uniref:HupE/UreJ family protein n=1 Tax=Nocardioides sp. SYSU DS0651 TaxID=3415955 RepID=UPI003F4BE21B
MAGALRRLALAGGAAAAAAVALLPSPADAHNLDSSTLSVHASDDGTDATISIALETLDQALGTEYRSSDIASYSDELTAYLADHLAVTRDDGTEWTETFTDVTRETVDGIDSINVEVSLDPGTADTSSFDMTYDAVIEALPDHEAVVVLTDASGDISTPGVLTSSDTTLTIGSGSSDTADASTGLVDMIGYGFHHVLEGADHLLFVVALLLTAPVAYAAGRWQPRPRISATLRDVVGVVTAFTVGHSATLIASALGWVNVPSQAVEILIALSVAVAAVHAVRPLVRAGERMIALGFGLVHGLAFAGILGDLGLSGSTSIAMLLAFNVGVELAQLTATLALFPSLYLLARTRLYPAVRFVLGALAGLAAAGWLVERLGLLANPLGAVEDAAIAHSWHVALGLGLIAALATVGATRTDRPNIARRVGPQAHKVAKRDIPDRPSMLSERAASCNSRRTVRPQGCTAAERP